MCFHKSHNNPIGLYMSIKNIPTKLKQQDRRSSLSSQSGQVLIETILLIVTGVALALILMNSFLGTAFKDWGENQFGSYLQCLLESGEVPALGGGAGACNNDFVAFGQGSGDGQGPGGPGGGGAGGAGGDDGSDGDGSAGGGRSGASGRVPIAGNRAGSGAGRGSPRRFISSSFGSSPGGEEGGSGSGSKGNEKSMNTGSTEVGLPGWATQRQQTTEIKKKNKGYKYYDSFYSDEQQKQKEEGDAVTISKEKVNSKDSKAPQAMLLKKRAPTSAPPPETDDEWTFGSFIKYIIIIAIIIGIILFLGSQLLQIKNSMD